MLNYEHPHSFLIHRRKKMLTYTFGTHEIKYIYGRIWAHNMSFFTRLPPSCMYKVKPTMTPIMCSQPKVMNITNYKTNISQICASIHWCLDVYFSSSSSYQITMNRSHEAQQFLTLFLARRSINVPLVTLNFIPYMNVDMRSVG